MVLYVTLTTLHMESADTIKLIIENQVCPAHGISPLVDIIGNELKITCCCTDFHLQCTQEIFSFFMLKKEYPYWVLQD
jgi:hypothetical protein